MRVAQLTATSSLPVPKDSYVYQIEPIKSHLAAISSDDSLRLIDPVTLRQAPGGAFSNVHAGVTCVKAPKRSSDVLITTGRDAAVRSWDLRTGAQITSFHDGKGGNAPVLSLASSGLYVAAGTELTSHQATLSIWDTRNANQPLRRYLESHNDDVTELKFHPTEHHTLMSGSTDSLINIYNTSQVDEEDALISITNHGSSIHHAGFLNEKTFFGLSHDETFSIYEYDPAQQSIEAAPDPSKERTFGDVRETLRCEYVVDVLDAGDGQNAIVAAGSYSNRTLDLVPVHFNPTICPNFEEDDTIRLQGAHGEEIVRSVCLGDVGSMAVFTAGEDGCVKAWRIPQEQFDANLTREMPDEGKKSNKETKKKKHRDGDGKASGSRFKPY